MKTVLSSLSHFLVIDKQKGKGWEDDTVVKFTIA